jgi:hypothetical protein
MTLSLQVVKQALLPSASLELTRLGSELLADLIYLREKHLASRLTRLRGYCDIINHAHFDALAFKLLLLREQFVPRADEWPVHWFETVIALLTSQIRLYRQPHGSATPFALAVT